ncbi:futalosine hydrolase [Crateriforma spongiae]|uniref:futalosine hydrolase n=1 Tax=Crateriforma spongiae TaxID=2724528 RepID=UPI0039AF2FB5
MSILVLVPTSAEYRMVDWPAIRKSAGRDFTTAICGFGLAAAGIGAMRLLAEQTPGHVFLVGLAGGFVTEPDADPPAIKVGDAVVFHRVTCHGIGAGVDMAAAPDQFLSADQMGWPHLEMDGSAVTDRLDLVVPDADARAMGRQKTLLSVTAASSSPDHARWRRNTYPDAVAEDMEGFAVAVACRVSQVPLTIVRGISNPVGNRDTRTWQTAPAMHVAAHRVAELIAGLESNV